VSREKLCEDVALGLQYLHERVPPIVHGDLKGENILVRDDGRAALCDFGLSMVLDGCATGFTTSGVGGTLRYMALEQLTDDEGGRSVQGDIYSYGCTYGEIMTGEVPFSWLKFDAHIITAISLGTLPYTIRYIISRHSLGFLERGWAAKPEDRPTMKDLKESVILAVGAGQDIEREEVTKTVSREILSILKEMKARQGPDPDYDDEKDHEN